MSIAFLDTETVTLESGHDVVWEIGVITRDGSTDREWRFQLRPNMGKANPVSLEINQFARRYLVPTRVQAVGWSPLNDAPPARLTFSGLAQSLCVLLEGRSIFGICPSFDTERLSLFLRKQWGPTYPGPPWHYQPHDVEDEVAGYLAGIRTAGAEPSHTTLRPPGPGLDWDEVLAVPRPTELLARAVGLDPDKYEKHTAIGDCRLARDMHDAATGGPF